VKDLMNVPHVIRYSNQEIVARLLFGIIKLQNLRCSKSSSFCL